MVGLTPKGVKWQSQSPGAKARFSQCKAINHIDAGALESLEKSMKPKDHENQFALVRSERTYAGLASELALVQIYVNRYRLDTDGDNRVGEAACVIDFSI